MWCVTPFILDVRFVDVPAGVTQEEGHTGFLLLPSAVLALLCLARRIQPFLYVAFPSSTVKSTIGTNELIVLHYLLAFFFFAWKKNPTSRDDTEFRTKVLRSESFEVTHWTTGATGFHIRLHSKNTLGYCLVQNMCFVSSNLSGHDTISGFPRHRLVPWCLS